MTNRCEFNGTTSNGLWNVLVVDDNNYIHVLFREILKNFKFEGKTINIISAFSTKEAIDILIEKDDIAVIFIDIFLEEKESGFLLSKYIREEIKKPQ